MSLCDLAAWHTIAYRDQHGHTYFSPALVSRGVQTVHDLRSQRTFPGCLPPTWAPRYRVPLAPSRVAGEFTLGMLSHWGTTSTLRVLMSLSTVEERVPEEAWGHFNSLRVSGRIRDFLRSALWKKLPVGSWISAWVPHAASCPLCGGLETHQHATTQCPHLLVASRLISQLLPRPDVPGVTPSPAELLQNHVTLSLSSAAGLLFWSAVSVHWAIRCAVSLRGSARVPERVFLIKRYQSLRAWSGVSRRHLPEAELVLFENPLRAQLQGVPMPHPRLLDPTLPLQRALPVRPSHATGSTRLKPNAATLRTRFVLALEPFLLAGWLAVYLDGSSELVSGVRVGGFGVSTDVGLCFSSPLPVHDPQTNIRAQLWPALWALRRHEPGTREFFCTDCNLVYLGATGGAAKWKRHTCTTGAQHRTLEERPILSGYRWQF